MTTSREEGGRRRAALVAGGLGALIAAGILLSMGHSAPISVESPPGCTGDCTFASITTTGDVTVGDDILMTDGNRVCLNAACTMYIGGDGFGVVVIDSAMSIRADTSMTIFGDVGLGTDRANNGTFAGASSGSPPTLTINGATDANVDFVVVPKGTGALRTTILDPRTSIKNQGTAGACSDSSAAVCVDDTLMVGNGSGTTVATISTGGLGTFNGGLNAGGQLISSVATPVSSSDAATKGYVDSLTTSVTTGAWSAYFVGAAAEGINGGGFTPYAVVSGEKFRRIDCVCAVAGTVGGGTGIGMGLYADGSQVATCEISGGDADACNDTAGKVLSCDLDYAITAGAVYSLRVESTTDCAGNPSGCLCNVQIVR